MKFLLHIWFVLMLLASVLVGCNRAPQYDSRLVNADSLVYDQYELVLSQLDSINPDELANNADRAYYALLLTQARYLNYFSFTNDSDINAAVKYYEKHSKELEKLTRAYLYKGAVMEDLGILDSAMTFYRRAEFTSSENDFFNRGYALYRIGKLYASHHAYDGRDIEYLEQALDYFRRSKNMTYQIRCLKDLGALYRGSDAEKAEKNLNEAISLCKIYDIPTDLMSCYNNLAYLYFMQGKHNKAYEQLNEIKKSGLDNLPENVYTTFACVYANLNMPDSAMYYLQLAQRGKEVDSAYFHSNNYLEPLSQIAKVQGKIVDYYKLSHESDSISFSSLHDPNIVNLMYTALSVEEEHQKELKKNQIIRNSVLAALAGAVFLTLLLIALLFYRRSHRYDKLVLELKDRSQSQINDLTLLQGNINEMKINDERLKGFILSHMGMMREMIEACYHEPNNRIAENMKRIVKFQDSNRDNWVRLYDYIDLEHNNIMTRTREQYPELNDRELLLLALTCMGFSYIQIAIIMGYSNATSVSVIKQRLVKKMGLDCSLNDYIQRNDEMKK